ncbi:hypothetical protein ACFL1R_00305 [Candidatus Latescibacterota bacterium]
MHAEGDIGRNDDTDARIDFVGFPTRLNSTHATRAIEYPLFLHSRINPCFCNSLADRKNNEG